MNNLESKKIYSISDLKALARQDIDWKTLTPITLCVILSSVLVSIIAEINPIIGGIFAIIALIFLLEFTAVMIYNYLAVRRNTTTVGFFSKFNKVIPLLGSTLVCMLISMTPYIIFAITFITSAMNDNNTFILLSLIGIILSIIYMIYMLLKYNLYQYLIVDKNIGAIASLKESRILMNGHKKKLFLLNISFIGWIILSMLFAAAMSAGIGLLPTYFMSSVSKIGAIVSTINTSLTLVVTILPVSIYQFMTTIEFYDDIVGNSLNNLNEYTTNKRVIRNTAIAAIGITLLSIVSFIIPIAKTEVPSSFKFLNTSYTINKGNISKVTDMFIKEKDSNYYEECGKVEPGVAPKFKIDFTVPNGYKIEESSCYKGDNYNLSFYVNDKDKYISILSTRSEGDAYVLEEMGNKDFEKDVEVYKTASGIEGETYTSTIDDTYNFRFVNGKYYYQLSSTDEKVLKATIDTIK